MAQNFYDDQAYQDANNLNRFQANQSLSYGDRAAALADPFMEQRKKEIDRLNLLQSNPGAIGTHPAFQFLRDEEMNAVNASNAAHGLRNSGRGLMALQDRAAGVASKYYFPLLQNQSNLAMSGSSPASAGRSYASGTERSQDYSQMAMAARSAGQAPKSATPPWWEQAAKPVAASTTASSTGLPYSSSTSAGGTFGDPRRMTLEQLNAEAATLGLPARYPQAASPTRDNFDPATMGDPSAYGLTTGLNRYQTTPAQMYGAEGRYPQVGAFDPNKPYGDYSYGGYD